MSGGTGFIGASLCRALRGTGHAVTVVTRDPNHVVAEPAIGWEALGDAVGESDALINLAGEPIADHRWTKGQKRRILESRVQATQALVDAVAAAGRRPTVLVSASAVGYYGPRGDDPVDEETPPGTDFLAGVCQAWESAARGAEALGLRVVRLRIGVVLAGGGGALARMVPAFRAFVGGPLGSGRQWLSWIHRDDVTGIVVDALANESYAGAVNATAPAPVTNREFVRTLGAAMARPAWLRVPGVALRLALGEMADMLLTGQRVLPRAAERLGYRWRYAALGPALRACVRP